MKRQLTLPLQLVLSLLIGMGLSFSSVRAFPPAAPIAGYPSSSDGLTPIPAQTGIPAPYVTRPGVWLVRAQFSTKSAPQVLKVTYLERGRITPFDRGDSQVEMLNAAGESLFSGSFTVNFLRGDPPRAVEELITMLIVPDMDQAVQVRLKTPQGETTYDLQR